MSIVERQKQAIEQGEAAFVVVYCNLENNSDDLVYCEASLADAAGAEIVDEYYVEYTKTRRALVITAEVK